MFTRLIADSFTILPVSRPDFRGPVHRPTCALAARGRRLALAICAHHGAALCTLDRRLSDALRCWTLRLCRCDLGDVWPEEANFGGIRFRSSALRGHSAAAGACWRRRSTFAKAAGPGQSSRSQAGSGSAGRESGRRSSSSPRPFGNKVSASRIS